MLLTLFLADDFDIFHYMCILFISFTYVLFIQANLQTSKVILLSIHNINIWANSSIISLGSCFRINFLPDLKF